MAGRKPSPDTEIDYERAAQDYLKRLPLEHFMEATPQATQREIFLASLALVKAQRPEVQYFNELLVQWPWKKKPRGKSQLGQVVPDNMVVVCKETITAVGSFDVPRQPAPPFWVLEYVSKRSVRKDTETNFTWYEQELCVPYYMTFYPDTQDLSLFRHNGLRYISVVPDAGGQMHLAELEMAVSLVEGWARFWFQGELLPLPAQLQKDVIATRRKLKRVERERDKARTERDLAAQERDLAAQERDLAAQERDRVARERDHANEELLRERNTIEELKRQLEQLRAAPARKHNGGR